MYYRPAADHEHTEHASKSSDSDHHFEPRAPANIRSRLSVLHRAGSHVSFTGVPRYEMRALRDAIDLDCVCFV